MPHSGFGATLNPDPSKKNLPPTQVFFQTFQFFSTELSFEITPNENLWFMSRPFSGRVSRFAEFFFWNPKNLDLKKFDPKNQGKKKSRLKRYWTKQNAGQTNFAQKNLVKKE